MKRKGKKSDFLQDLHTDMWVKASLPEINNTVRSEVERRRNEQEALHMGTSETKPDSNLLEK